MFSRENETSQTRNLCDDENLCFVFCFFPFVIALLYVGTSRTLLSLQLSSLATLLGTVFSTNQQQLNAFGCVEATCFGAKRASGGFTEDGRRKRNCPRTSCGGETDVVRGQRSDALERQQRVKLMTLKICRIAPLNAQP